MAEATGLQDGDILELAKTIRDRRQLYEFGVSVLKASLDEIDTAFDAQNKCASDAACSLLRTWKEQQRTNEEAYADLVSGLREEKWTQAAIQLEGRVEGFVGTSKLTPSRKL